MTDTERLAAYLADLATRPTTHWVHNITHDHRHGVRTEHTTRGTSLTPEEAIASRIQRLRWVAPEGGWSRDGSTLHIRHAEREEWITYQDADAHTGQWRTLELLDTHTEAA